MSLAKVNLSDFDYIRTIGIGRFSRVQLMQNKSSKKYFAVKHANIKQIIDAHMLEYIQREKQLLINFSNPFIVSLKFYGLTMDSVCLGFEFVQGGEFTNRMYAKGPFSLADTQFYGSQIALALDYLHEQYLIYRDLKPENILLGADGYIKLTDFGFAKKLEGRTFTRCGTVEYMAPECFGEKGYQFAADWWSFGVLIYQMATGTLPFEGETEETTRLLIQQNDVQFTNDIDDKIKRVIINALDKNEALRLQGKQIFDYSFLTSFDLARIKCKQYEAPFKPQLDNDGDSKWFYPYNDSELEELAKCSKAEYDLFVDW